MIRGGRERAVTVQIGAVLLLAILVTALSLYQVNAVPEENRGVESDHHRTVQSELVDVRNGIVNTPYRGSAGSHTISLGTGYPSRSFTVNPPPATGTIRTVGTNDESYAINITNARPADRDAAQAWNESGQRYETGAIAYQPHYNEYTDAPNVVYEHSVLYNEQGGNRAALTDQVLVDGNRITLVTVDGNYSKTGTRTAAVDVSTVSPSANAISLEPTNSGNITIRIPTRLSVSEWAELLAEEDVTVRDGGSDGAFDTVEVVLDPGTYDLQMAKVGLGTGVDAESEAYVTVVDSPDNVSEGESSEMTLEVRDRHNNPVSDVRVNATDDGYGTLTPDNETTGRDGRVTFTYHTGADEGGSEVTLEASFTVDPDASAIDSSRPENVSRTISVSSGSGDGSGGSGSSPSIDQFTVSDDSNVNNHADYTVDWAVSDSDSDLNQVTVELIDNETGAVEDSAEYAVGSRGSVSGSATVSAHQGAQQWYKIQITVTDNAGNTETESVKDYADGTDP